MVEADYVRACRRLRTVHEVMSSIPIGTLIITWWVLTYARLLDCRNIPHLLGTSASQFIAGCFASRAPIKWDMWFMHDGALAHFCTIFRNVLNATFPARWMGRGRPVAWRIRSPDLNPLDFQEMYQESMPFRMRSYVWRTGVGRWYFLAIK